MANVGSDLFVGGRFSLAGDIANGNLARLSSNLDSVSVPVGDVWGLFLLFMVLLIAGLNQHRKKRDNVC